MVPLKVSGASSKAPGSFPGLFAFLATEGLEMSRMLAVLLLIVVLGGCRTPSTAVSVRVEKDLSARTFQEFAENQGKLVVGVTTSL